MVAAVRAAAAAAHLLAVLALFAAVAARPSISLAEWTALRQLFHDTGGAAGAWTNATGWDVGDYDSAPDPCDGRSWLGIYDWHGYGGMQLDVPACGINATAGTPRVQVLSLTADPTAQGPVGNGLRGALGRGLAHLSALRVVAVNGNPTLTGVIPDLATLTALQVLDLHNNALIGTVPDLTAQTALQRLALNNNALTGTIPRLVALTVLQQAYLYSNVFTGTVPDLAALTALQHLFLNDNALTGAIPKLAALTALQQLWLYNNAITGTIPPLLHLTALHQLLLHSNQLRGAVPPLPPPVLAGTPEPGDDDTYHDSNHWALNTDPWFTLFDNRLSCALPSASVAPGAGLVAVVAFGNRFSAPAPRWVRKETRDAAFLFVPQSAAWRWIVGYLGGGALLLSATAHWVSNRRPCAGQREPTEQPSLRPGSTPKPGTGSTDADAVRAFGVLQHDGAAVLAMLSCLACGTLLPAYTSGAQYYECGEPLMHTSLAYLADAPRSALAAAVFVCVFVWASAAAVGYLQARLGRTAVHCAAADNDDDCECDRARDMDVATPLRALLAGLTWLGATALLSAPTVLYVVALYLPADNVLHIGAAFTVVLRRGVPFLLAFINAVLLPALTRLLVRHGLRLAKKAPARVAALSSWLLLLARLLTTIVIPVGAVLVLGAECGGQWKALWSVCSGASNTTVHYDGKTGCHPVDSVGCKYYIPGGLNAPALTAEQVCAGSVDSGYGSGQCARGVLEALAPLFAEKLAIAACLQPALLLLFFQSGWASRVSKAVFGYADGQYRMGLDLEFAATLAQVEVALFYGVALPVVLPIAAASLATHWLAFRWLLRARGVAALPCASPPVAWLRVSVALQAALATWFFGATQGAAYGWAVGALAFAGVMAVEVAGARHCKRQHGREVHLTRLVSNERGLRLTTLAGAEACEAATGTSTHNVLMTADSDS